MLVMMTMSGSVVNCLRVAVVLLFASGAAVATRLPPKHDGVAGRV